MPLTAALGLLTAWLLARQDFRGRAGFDGAGKLRVPVLVVANRKACVPV